MARDDGARPAGGGLIAVSYNVHRCVGGDGVCDPRRVAHVLRPLGAQLIGLQELYSEYGSIGAKDQAGALAHELDMDVVRGPTLVWGERNFGNALLTTLPIRSVTRIDLSVGGRREPRGAIDVAVTVGSQRVRVLVTHLGLRGWERRRQIDQLATAIGRDPTPLIVLGDLNEWRPGTHRTLRRLDSRLGPDGRDSPRTFPAALPLLRLDRILVSPKHALVRLEVIDTALSRATSDHLPLRALIDQDLLGASPNPASRDCRVPRRVRGTLFAALAKLGNRIRLRAL